jgi:hypothetical protein
MRTSIDSLPPGDPASPRSVGCLASSIRSILRDQRSKCSRADCSLPTRSRASPVSSRSSGKVAPTSSISPSSVNERSSRPTGAGGTTIRPTTRTITRSGAFPAGTATSWCSPPGTRSRGDRATSSPSSSQPSSSVRYARRGHPTSGWCQLATTPYIDASCHSPPTQRRSRSRPSGGQASRSATRWLRSLCTETRIVTRVDVEGLACTRAVGQADRQAVQAGPLGHRDPRARRLGQERHAKTRSGRARNAPIHHWSSGAPISGFNTTSECWQRAP